MEVLGDAEGVALQLSYGSASGDPEISIGDWNSGPMSKTASNAKDDVALALQSDFEVTLDGKRVIVWGVAPDASVQATNMTVDNVAAVRRVEDNTVLSVGGVALQQRDMISAGLGAVATALLRR